MWPIEDTPSEKDDTISDLRDKLAAVERELAALKPKYAQLVSYYDVHFGTPCEQIRHQQEVEKLTAELAEARALNHEYEITVPGSTISALQRDNAALRGKLKELGIGDV